MNPYLFHPDEPSERARLRTLGALHDDVSVAVLTTHVGRYPHFLELGPGSGSLVCRLRKEWPSTRFTLVDVNFAGLAVDCADNRTEASAESIPLPASSFDVAHARLVFSHVRNVPAAFGEMFRLLSPSGFLVIEELDSRPAQRPFTPAFDAYRKALQAKQTRSTYDRGLGIVLATGKLDIPGFRLVGLHETVSISSAPFDAVRNTHRATMDAIGLELIEGGLLTASGLRLARTSLDIVDAAHPLQSSSLVSAIYRRCPD